MDTTECWRPRARRDNPGLSTLQCSRAVDGAEAIGVALFAHAPVASALHATVRHFDPALLSQLLVIDLAPGAQRDAVALRASMQLAERGWHQLIVLVDILGAEPWWVAERTLILRALPNRVVAGVNGPMLLALLSVLRRPGIMDLDRATQYALSAGRQSLRLIRRDGWMLW